MHSRSHGLRVLILLDRASSFFFWCSDAHWLFREAPGVPRVFSMEDGINIRNEENRSSTLASMKFTVILASIAIAAGSTARSLTVYNACPFTIW